MTFDAPRAGPRPQSPEQMIRAQTHTELQHLQLQVSVDQFMKKAQRDLAASGVLAKMELAKDATADLPQEFRSQWQGIIDTLQSYATRKKSDGSEGDPLSVLTYAANIRDQRAQLQSFPFDPAGHRAAAIIEDAIRSVENVIGPPPPGRLAGNPYAAQENKTVLNRESNLIRTGFFITAGLGAVVGTAMAMLNKEESERNWTLPGMLALVAAVSAGWGSLTKSGTEKAANDLTFLTKPGGPWENLQKKYNGLSGPGFATLAENIFRESATDTDIAEYLKGKHTDPQDPGKLEHQRKAILAITPKRIQPAVLRMLETDSGVIGKDFKLFTGELLKLGTAQNGELTFPQTVAVRYILSSANASNLQALVPASGSGL